LSLTGRDSPEEVPLVPAFRILPTQHKLLRLLTFSLLLVGLAVLASGCIFSPPKNAGGGGGGDPPPEYPALISPQKVLLALTQAYKARDSTEYKQLYDSSYVGQSTDLNDPPLSQVSTFRYADEVAHMAALQRTTTITRVEFDLGLENSWTRLSSDDPSHPEYAEIQISTGFMSLAIYDGGTTYEVQSINPITFWFKPTPSATPGDTTWKIVRWEEIGQTRPPATP
jgi:hypothetical protein